MKIGGSLGPDGDLVEKIEELPEELEFVEFPLGEEERPMEEIDPEAVREALVENDLGLVVHLPFRQRLVTDVDIFNDAVLDYHRELIQFAVEMGAEKFVVHADMRDQDSEPQELELPKQIKELKEIGEEMGAEVCFENIGHWNGMELFELGEMLEDLDASMCFDTGHAFSEVGQEEMEEFLDEYSHIISHLHLQDTREGRDMHLPIGSEEIEFEPLGEKLSGFEGTATMEIFTSSNDYIMLSREKVLEYF